MTISMKTVINWSGGAIRVKEIELSERKNITMIESAEDFIFFTIDDFESFENFLFQPKSILIT